jgi:hypothetical protein
MRINVDRADDSARPVLGRVGNEPLINTHLGLGQESQTATI